MMKKKAIVCASLMLSALFLLGLGIASVTLLHKTKVIDLQKAIEIARPGGDVNTDDINADNEPSEDVIDNNTEGVTENIEKTIEIIVSGKNVEIQGVKNNDITVLENKISEFNGPRVTFELVDNYAESETFKQLIKILNKLKMEKDLHYSIKTE